MTSICPCGFPHPPKKGAPRERCHSSWVGVCWGVARYSCCLCRSGRVQFGHGDGSPRPGVPVHVPGVASFAVELQTGGRVRGRQHHPSQFRKHQAAAADGAAQVVQVRWVVMCRPRCPPLLNSDAALRPCARASCWPVQDTAVCQWHDNGEPAQPVRSARDGFHVACRTTSSAEGRISAVLAARAFESQARASGAVCQRQRDVGVISVASSRRRAGAPLLLIFRLLNLFLATATRYAPQLDARCADAPGPSPRGQGSGADGLHVLGNPRQAKLFCIGMERRGGGRRTDWPGEAGKKEGYRGVRTLCTVYFAAAGRCPLLLGPCSIVLCRVTMFGSKRLLSTANLPVVDCVSG